MAVFQLQNRVEILRQMVARVVARSTLNKLRRNSVVFHILAAASASDAGIYFQLAQLRQLFSLDKATGSDLDERAREIQPSTIRRRTEIYASANLIYTRTGTVGTLAIPVGSIASGSDNSGTVGFRTTAAGSITPGNTVSAPIPAIATVAGSRGNLASGTIRQMSTRIPGAVSVDNPSAAVGGRDREPDDQFVARVKGFIQTLSRGTVAAIEGFARQVRLADGKSVLFVKVFEPVIPSGIIELYIDDGTGSIETYDSSFVGGIPQEDLILAAAAGGEDFVLTVRRPIRDDVALIVRVNDAVIVRGVDWEIDPTRGQIELLPGGAFPAGLANGDKIAANYRFYTGLIQETQRVISGDPLSPISYPGVEAGGITTLVKPAGPVWQTVRANATVLPDFDTATVFAAVLAAIQAYINNLDVGADVIVSEIIERAMGVDGMFNFKLITLSGTTPPVDQVTLASQVARVQSADIVIF